MSDTNVKAELGGDLYLAVRIGSEFYAFPLHAVDEVLPALPFACVDQSSELLRGVVFVREQLLPVLNTAHRLGLRDYQRPWEPQIVSLRSHDRLIGIEVDEALDLIQLDQAKFLAAERVWIQNKCVTAVVELQGRIYRLLDPDHLLSRDESEELQSSSTTMAVVE